MGVQLIVHPDLRVGVDIVSDFAEFVIIADDAVVVVALPDVHARSFTGSINAIGNR